MTSKLVVCESIAAIVTHLQSYQDEHDLSYSGHHPRLRALCDMEIAWDTKIPVNMASCRSCREAAGLGPHPHAKEKLRG